MLMAVLPQPLKRKPMVSNSRTESLTGFWRQELDGAISINSSLGPGGSEHPRLLLDGQTEGGGKRGFLQKLS